MTAKKTSASDISLFLKETGFIFEMEMAEVLKKYGYKTHSNEYFLDLDTGKKRELDIVAKKTLNSINIFLVTECKMSLQDDWVFILSEPTAPRYYAAPKHSPSVGIDKIRDSRIFHNLP